MNTNRRTSEWLDRVAQGIEQGCPVAVSVISTAYGTADLVAANCPKCTEIVLAGRSGSMPTPPKNS